MLPPLQGDNTSVLTVILGRLGEIPVVTGSDTYARYQSILGVAPEAPSLDHLRRLVRAQIIRVPFENISKLYLKKTRSASYIPSLEEHLNGIERHRFGGTCYANNPYFAELLRHLGYDVTMCGADMSKPDVHVVSVVRLEGREYLVDVGYGAPFYEPMARDLDHEQEIVFGRNRFLLHPQDDQRRSRVDHFLDGELIHGYVAKPEARTIDHFDRIIRDSYSDAATFMNVVVVERFFADRSLRFHNFDLTESTPHGATATRLADRSQLVEAIEHHCGFPAEIVRQAIADIALEGDIYT
jgi:arylamine N-acetyltransferase